MLDGVDPAHEVQPRLLDPAGKILGKHHPEPHGFEDVGRHVQLVDAQEILAEDLLLSKPRTRSVTFNFP